jgi:hypothetical protein
MDVEEEEEEEEEEGEEAARQIRQREEHRAAIFAAIRDVNSRRPRETGESTLDSSRRWSLQTEHFERNHDLLNDRSRFDLSTELVHVPQPPDRRYSWEED